MQPSQKKLFLLDAMALIYRAYYALNKNPRINSKGQNTSAILGFTNSLYEIIKKEKPSHIAVALYFWTTLRQVDFTDYKANEKYTGRYSANLPYILPLSKLFRFNIRVNGLWGGRYYWNIAKRAEKENFKVYMVTTDKDYGQLVSDNIFMYKPAHMGSGISILGVKEICEKYSIQYPEQLIDLLGLWGDTSDNIPGIKGIGEKTAIKLISEFGSIESLIENVDKVSSEKLRLKIEEGTEMAILSKMLATILLDVPIDFNEELLKYKEPNLDVLKNIFDELEFRTLAQRIFTDFSVKKKGTMGVGMPTLLFPEEEVKNEEIFPAIRFIIQNMIIN